MTKEEKVSARGRRFSVQRKMAVVARLLRGEPLELVARETNVTIQKLTEWRERALAGATSALKERDRDDRDDEIARLKAKVGEITMDNELLYAICGRPRMASVFLGTSNDLVGCGHMSGLFARSVCPLALMKSDDEDPYQDCELLGLVA